MSRESKLCLGILATAALLFAQSAELSGLVRDPSGASISKTRLEFRNEDTGVRFWTQTNQDGFYFLSLKPGAYDATVQTQGFRIMTRRGIVLNVGDRASLDFTLLLTGISNSITVTPDPDSTVNSVGSGVGTVVDQRSVADMPLNGRSLQSLIEMTPGVVIAPSYQGAPGQFSVNGQRTDTNYFTIDGVSANFGSTASVTLGQTIGGAIPALNILGGTNSLVSADAMQEFRNQTSSYAPEYGRTPGAQISIVTKSGTNQFHGTAYDYLRNDIFDARNWFNMVPQPRPPLRQNDFGGTLGGPIRKDHTFFFVSYEGLRLRQPATAVGDFLTAAARAKAPPVYQPFVNAYPLPTGPVNPDGITASLSVAYSDPSRFDATSIRIDHTIGSRVTLFARYNGGPSTQGFYQYAELENDTADITTATAGASIVVSPSKVNEFRANWSRSAGKVESVMLSMLGAVAPPQSILFPSFISPEHGQVGFGMPFTSGGVSEGTRANNVQRQLNFVDTFSMTTGVHQLKFGIDFRRMKPTKSVAGAGYATIPFDYATVLAGETNYVLIGSSDPITATLANYSLFAQDTWKLTNHLTLTYGLRWEINTPPVSTTREKPLYAVDGIFNAKPVGQVEAPLWRTRFGNIAPRVGAAWQFAPDTVVRGGFGLFYDLGYGARAPGSFPYSRFSATSYNPGIPFDLNSPAFQPLPFTTAIPPNTSISAVDPDLDLPVTYQWNVAWERRFSTYQTLSATYVGAWGRNLQRQDLLVPPGSIFVTQGGAVGVTYNSGYSHYNALQIQFLRRLSSRLQALVSYTLARSMDTNSTDDGLDAGSTQILAGNVRDLRSQLPPLAPSDFDARHVFSAAVSWELPAPRKSVRGLLKDWALDAIVRAKSAPPLNVFYQRQFPGGYYDIQPDIVPGQPLWIPDANEPEGRILNPRAFAIPAGATGNFPRNSLRGFPFDEADLALRRRFALTERLKLDARVEYFNAFNHPSFANPVTLWGTVGVAPYSLFGKVYPGDTLNVGLGGGGIMGGQAAIFAPGGPRSAQFTLKLVF